MKLGWIGSVAFQVIDGERELVFDLAEGQTLPPEFKEGDEIDVANRPAHPASLAMGHGGYYEITHAASGKTIQVQHSTSAWRFQKQ